MNHNTAKKSAIISYHIHTSSNDISLKLISCLVDFPKLVIGFHRLCLMIWGPSIILTVPEAIQYSPYGYQKPSPSPLAFAPFLPLSHPAHELQCHSSVQQSTLITCAKLELLKTTYWNFQGLNFICFTRWSSPQLWRLTFKVEEFSVQWHLFWYLYKQVP